jgi:hypothetical protein
LTTAPQVAAEAGRRRTTTTLTVACMTAGPAARVAALLAGVRDVADEIVVALDDRAAADVREAMVTVADRVLLYEYAEPVDRAIPWLHLQCHGDWVLNLDDDEIPSPLLLEALPELISAEDVTHYWLPRRWLFPDLRTFLDEPPWRPDYQLRLTRNDPRLLSFSADLHRPLAVLGPGRFLELPVWHLDCVVRSREAREAKALKYDRLRPGLRFGGVSLNAAYFLPERRPQARLSPVPDEDRAVIQAVMAAPPPAVEAAKPDLAHATRLEIDSLWPGRPFGPDAYRARLELLDPALRLAAGEQRAVDVRVTNEGDETWRWGSAGEPAIRVASWWSDKREPLRTPLPADLAPGTTAVVPVHVRAPLEVGRHRLEIDLVHEHVRWFGCSLGVDVDVEARRRVALVGGDAASEDVLELLQAYPELEPLLVARDEELPDEPSGHSRVPGVRSYLFGGDPDQPGSIGLGVTVLRRSVALTRRKSLPPAANDFAAALSDCRLLVVAGLDAPEDSPAPRELARVAAIAATAKATGVPVAVRRDALPASARFPVRMLRRLVESRTDLVFGESQELNELLGRCIDA